MPALKFDIRFPNGHREVAVVEGERALVGSASHCDVRLPMDQAAYEHLLVEVSAGTVRVEARAEHPPATINGMRLTQSTVTRDATLGVGDVRLFVEYVTEDADSADAIKAKDKQESSPLIRVAALIALPLAGYMLLLEPDSDFQAPPAAAPALFASAVPSCPQAAPQQAVAAAEEKMDQAIGKRERMPFAPREGMAAVTLYDTAAACFTIGQSSALAREASEAAESLRQTITRDFRTRRLRLSRMLAVGDYELANRDVTVLEALTDGKKGPFVNWLAGVKRELKAKGAK